MHFDGSYGACVVRVPVFTTVVYILVQTNVAPNAFRTVIIIPQYMTKFAMDQVCDESGLNVLIRFDISGAISFLYSLWDRCAS